MDTEMSSKLRAPFGAEQISKLPRITCSECRGVRGTKVCAKHTKSTCPECGSYITEKHIHLDYVGHADVTARLLAVDPEWDWKPVAVDEMGLPVVSHSSDGQHIMWIKLIVGGVTRLGVGSVPPDAVDIEKQLIGDAIRNAAMRFGVALDLWSKAERGEAEHGGTSVQGTPVTITVADGVGPDGAKPGEAITQGRPVFAATAVQPSTCAAVQERQAQAALVMFEDEPLPEYRGDGDGDTVVDWIPSDTVEPAQVFPAAAVVQAVAHEPSGQGAGGASTTGTGGSVSESQKKGPFTFKWG